MRVSASSVMSSAAEMAATPASTGQATVNREEASDVEDSIRAVYSSGMRRGKPTEREAGVNRPHFATSVVSRGLTMAGTKPDASNPASGTSFAATRVRYPKETGDAAD